MIDHNFNITISLLNVINILLSFDTRFFLIIEYMVHFVLYVIDTVT